MPGYRAVRNNIFNDIGWLVSSYLMYQCFKEMDIYSKSRKRSLKRSGKEAKVLCSFNK